MTRPIRWTSRLSGGSASGGTSKTRPLNSLAAKNANHWASNPGRPLPHPDSPTTARTSSGRRWPSVRSARCETAASVLAGAAAADLKPVRDEAGVSAGLDAQLRRPKVLPFIHITFMESDGNPGVFGEKVAAARRSVGQLSQASDRAWPVRSPFRVQRAAAAAMRAHRTRSCCRNASRLPGLARGRAPGRELASLPAAWPDRSGRKRWRRADWRARSRRLARPRMRA
jgi:hypothetical protein